MSVPNVYDRVLYPSYPLPLANPRRLETLAALHGMRPAPAVGCRALEIGCGTGMNLIALGAYLPGSRFVGIDLAKEPISLGRQMCAELALGNVELHALDLRKLPADWGRFDYIIAHGVYSWLPADVRDRLLAVCGKFLADQGVAFISYNTLPGCHVRRMIRDMLLLHLGDLPDPERRLSRARDLLQQVAVGTAGDDSDARLVHAEALRTAGHVDALLFHDDLAEVNHPVYLHEFVAHARRHGLDYLVDADFHEGQPVDLPEEVLAELKSYDRVGRQQYLDFLKCRRFRHSLLCRKEVRRLEPDPDGVRGLWVASEARAAAAERPLEEGVEVEFQATNGATLQSEVPLTKAMMLELEDSYPESIRFETLVERARQRVRSADVVNAIEEDLAPVLLGSYATGLAELYLHPPAALRASERPRTPRLARWQLERGEPAVTNLMLRNLLIDDADFRKIIVLADGSRPRAALEAECGSDLEAQLCDLARLGLLEPAPPAKSSENG